MGTRQGLGRLAIAAGLVAIAADLAYFLFVANGGPYGWINDLANGAFAVLAGWLGWTLRDRAGTAAAGAALVGAAIAVVGPWLVISGTTGWFLAGLVSAVGLALIGACVLAIGRSLAGDDRWPRGLARLGIVTGVVMLTGLLAIPGVLVRLDDAATAPAWGWLGFTGWLGAMLLFPAWAIWLGRSALARADVGRQPGSPPLGRAAH